MFNIASGLSWDVVIEIPHRAGHLDEPAENTLGQEEGLWQELPVLAYLGTTKAPAAAFDVDADTRLVCKYLRAFKDNTIDELYRAAAGGAKVERMPSASSSPLSHSCA